MRFFKRMTIGLLIGIACITPGLSGGALAAALGLYQPMIKAVSRFFDDVKRNLRFLLPIGLGGVIGIIGFSNVMEWLMQTAPNQVSLVFLGLVAGSLPSLVRTANSQGFRLGLLGYTAVALTILPALAILQRTLPPATATAGGWLEYIGYGVILALGTIVPGISTSFILMSLGVYDELLGAIAGLNLTILMSAAVGFILGTMMLIRLVEMLFRRYHAPAHYAVLGFLLSSAILILPSISLGWALLLDISLFLAGIGLSSVLLRIGDAH